MDAIIQLADGPFQVGDASILSEHSVVLDCHEERLLYCWTGNQMVIFFQLGTIYLIGKEHLWQTHG
jgi:hypothetical protein